MNPTSNVDFSHDGYMNEYKNERFHGYKGHLQYLDYFVKVDVARREGNSHVAQDDNKNENGKENEQNQIQVQNKPLIIAGDEGCGKTALISHWLTTSHILKQSGSKHQILLVHVAGASSCERKYQSFIHRALVKLRRTFPEVQTRLVHIIDDKLRINFSRCLDLVSNAIASGTAGGQEIAPNQLGRAESASETTRDPAGNGGSRDGRIIMILDGLENFKDSENDKGVESEQSADWVPWSFPDRFRVIILTRKRSKAMNHFKLRKCPLLYMGDQNHFNYNEINGIIQEHVNTWRHSMSANPGTLESFEARLQVIKGELVTKRELIHKELQRTQLLQRESLSEEQLLVLNMQDEELAEGNYYLLAKPADELEAKFAKPTERQLNPLVIRCILYFYLYCGSSLQSGPGALRPLDMRIILGCKTLHQLFTTAIKHFRECLFASPPKPNTSSSKSLISESQEKAKEKFDHLLAYILVARKGLSWQELKELIPSLTDEDIKVFTDIFGFLLVQYAPPDSEIVSGKPRQPFIFFKHATFKKAVKDTIEVINNDNTRAQFHKNISLMIEKQETHNQFMWQRRVDELCFHYQMSGMWIKLKDLISSVEVFSTMFVVPELRYELAQQWLWLLGQQGGSGTAGQAKASKQQCDPVVEYNKALESFIIKYRPTSKELFVIMIQLCRFFKEDLAELVQGAEASEAVFAHPPLLGTREIESIRLLKEVEKLGTLYQPDREDGAEKAKQAVTSSNQLIASLKGFNLDNDIVRDQIIDMIRAEVQAEAHQKEHQMISMVDDSAMTHYHYKRWLWVQFPWCTIDVHSDISNIMELFSGGGSQGGDSSLYISATKENELAKATLNILLAAKARSKKSGNSGNPKGLNQSNGASSYLNKSLKKSLGRKSGTSKSKQSLLPPVNPGSTKNQDVDLMGLSKTLGHSRSISASRGQRGDLNTSGHLPMLRLDSEDRKSPEKAIAKISRTLLTIEQGKMKEIEVENVALGAQLNNLNFLIYKKEKELKQQEEHYQAILLEQSAHDEGLYKLEVMEAKLLKAYEDLNRVEVERKRIEQIVRTCDKNNPNNEEQIRNLEQQIEVFSKLISYHQTQMATAHKDVEQFKKQLAELNIEMEEREKLRHTHISKITDAIERKRRLQQLVIDGEEERKNFALLPTETTDIDTTKLKYRQINYKKWKAKLSVTKAFVQEKVRHFDTSFRKMIDIAGLRTIDVATLLQKENPLTHLEGLIGFIERANDLDKSKKQKEARIDKLKRDREELLTELKKWENGVQLIECGHVERAQKKLYTEDKTLRIAKEGQQRQLSLIADMKSGFINIAKILGIEDQFDIDQDQVHLIDKICDRFIKLEQANKGPDGHDLASGDHSSRSKQDEYAQLLSPQGTRGRKKQPKQKQPTESATGVLPKQSPQVVASPQGSMVEKQNTIPKKIMDLHEKKEVDSDTEERMQLAQDRMRLKKSISSHGNYTLQKVAGQTMQSANVTQGKLSSTSEQKEEKAESRNNLKPVFSLKKFKAENLSASNPIIGAPLGDHSMSQKTLAKYSSSIGKTAGKTGLQLSVTMTKPSLGGTKLPKAGLKKSLKFAKGGDFDESGINDL